MDILGSKGGLLPVYQGDGAARVYAVFIFGTQGGIRTPNKLVKSQLLCR